MWRLIAFWLIGGRTQPSDVSLSILNLVRTSRGFFAATACALPLVSSWHLAVSELSTSSLRESNAWRLQRYPSLVNRDLNPS